MIKIILTDDHNIFRQGLKSIISIEKFGEVVAEAVNGQEFLDLLPKHNPDLVLMDIDMPVMNGIEAMAKAIKLKPELKILCLTSHGDEAHYYSAIEAGAKGFVIKSAGLVELQTAINEVSSGGNYISQELLRNIISKVNSEKVKSDSNTENLQTDLTEQETAVLLNISKGLSNEEISKELSMPASLVDRFKEALFAKTNSKNSAGLIMYAIKKKLIVVR